MEPEGYWKLGSTPVIYSWHTMKVIIRLAKEEKMDFLAKVFNWMVIIGMILLLGRLLTMAFLLLEIPFTTFFKDYNLISIIIFLIGAMGQQFTKPGKK
ncbi:hypothetical protein [Peribacillus simplex]|uniref:hypothetical protein n=1 Tax=Peribacillus simplex TaxID=1478 RepID=UPI003335BEBF